VREGGVEPPRPKAPDPKSGVAAVTPLPRDPEHRERGQPVPGTARAGGPGSTDAPRVAWSGRLSAVPRDPRQIQLEIDAARESLAATLDQLVYRSSPQRLKSQGQAAVQQFLQTPVGMAAVGAVGLLMTLVVVQKVRHRND
jgi:hypothetical protein